MNQYAQTYKTWLFANKDYVDMTPVCAARLGVALADLAAAGIQGVVLRWMEQRMPFAPSLSHLIQFHYGWINGYILLDPTHPAKDGEQTLFTEEYVQAQAHIPAGV